MTASLLEQLPDIDLPAPIGIWPLAVGWYAVIAVVGVFILVAIGYYVQRARKLRPRKLILRKLADLQLRYAADHDAVNLAADVSALLRKACLLAFARRDVAGLQGQAWLEFLDQTGKTTDFTKGVGQVLVTAPYQLHAQFSVPDLLNLVSSWVIENIHHGKKHV